MRRSSLIPPTFVTSGWTISTTDSSLTSGRAALSALGYSAGTFTFDDYTLKDLAGGGSDDWAVEAGYSAKLAGAMDATKTLTMGDGTIYGFPTMSSGKAWANSITDPAGHVLNLDYSTIASDGKSVQLER